MMLMVALSYLAEQIARPGSTVISCLIFFFSSRRRHTRLQGDWSSDVCSSDLKQALVTLSRENSINEHRALDLANNVRVDLYGEPLPAFFSQENERNAAVDKLRSEERRVGKSVDLGGRRIIKKKKQRVS